MMFTRVQRPCEIYGRRAVPMTLLGTLALCLWLIASVGSSAADGGCEASDRFVLALHGGAAYSREPDHEALAEPVLLGILDDGRRRLAAGASALDAVEVAIKAMEDSGVFNAGKGSIRNRAGAVEMDASIMEGRELKAGAVAAVRKLKNPIAAARMVMEQSLHVLLVGKGADLYAEARGADTVEPDYFRLGQPPSAPKDHGTVGAIALDRCGDLAAGTSTGGFGSKLPGRVGDSPIVGAGTYADNATAAISATGHGEFFIRHVVAYDIVARVRYLGLSLEESARQVILEEGPAKEISGGIIALDPEGKLTTAYNTPGLTRGVVSDSEDPRVELF